MNAKAVCRAGLRGPTRLGVLGVAACVGMALGGCSGGGDTLDDFPLSWEQIQAVIDQAGPSQLPFLADGVVTPAERERAFLNAVTCAADQGVEVYDYTLYPYGSEEFLTRVIGQDGDGQVDESDLGNH